MSLRVYAYIFQFRFLQVIDCIYKHFIKYINWPLLAKGWFIISFTVGIMILLFKIIYILLILSYLCLLLYPICNRHQLLIYGLYQLFQHNKSEELSMALQACFPSRTINSSAKADSKFKSTLTNINQQSSLPLVKELIINAIPYLPIDFVPIIISYLWPQYELDIRVDNVHQHTIFDLCLDINPSLISELKNKITFQNITDNGVIKSIVSCNITTLVHLNNINQLPSIRIPVIYYPYKQKNFFINDNLCPYASKYMSENLVSLINFGNWLKYPLPLSSKWKLFFLRVTRRIINGELNLPSTFLNNIKDKFVSLFMPLLTPYSTFNFQLQFLPRDFCARAYELALKNYLPKNYKYKKFLRGGVPLILTFQNFIEIGIEDTNETVISTYKCIYIEHCNTFDTCKKCELEIKQKNQKNNKHKLVSQLKIMRTKHYKHYRSQRRRRHQLNKTLYYSDFILDKNFYNLYL